MNGSLTVPTSGKQSVVPSPTLVTPEDKVTTSDFNLSGLTDDEAFESETAWLNETLAPISESSSSTHSLTTLETQLSRTLGLLEIATQDTSILVDSTIDKISRSVPRLTFDLQLMRENALLLRFTLDGIRKRGSAAGEDSEIGKIMDRLKVLDLVKQRMEAARDVLREAESWSTLESEVTGLVGEQAYAKAAERLEEAARSMIVFQNTAEYEGRRALMVSLQNQLEASLSTSLVKAINSRDVKTCKAYYGIFGQIQREAEFTAYYFGSRRAHLVELWSSAKLLDIAEGPRDGQFPLSTADSPQTSLSGPAKFTAFLEKFYSELHTLLSEEKTYLPAIFPSPAPTLSAFIQTTLEGLSPSFNQRLSAVSNAYGAMALPELILAYKATQDFAMLAEGIMAKIGSAASYAPPASPSGSQPQSSPTSIKKERRLSKRMSVSKRSGSSRSISLTSPADVTLQGTLDATDEIVRPWEVALYEPFLDYQVEYAELERSFLANEISKFLAGQPVIRYTSSSDDVESGPRVLWSKTSVVFSLVEDSVGRALSFTHGYAAVGLTEVLDDQIAKYMDRRKEELNSIRKGLTSGFVNSVHAEQVEEEMTLEGLEYSQEDWGTFQYGLRLLHTCQSTSERLTACEGKLKGKYTLLAQTMKETRSDPAYRIPGTTKGAITFLRQSILNSAEFAALLGPLEQPKESLPSHSSYSLLPRARMSVREFARATQNFLHETILGPLLVHLSEYAALPAWTMSADQQRAGGRGAFDLAIPTFSLSPTETISRVGEGLFNLPRLFEIYADDDALAFSIETLPFVDSDALKALHSEPVSIPPTTPKLSSTRMNSFDANAAPALTDPAPKTPSRARNLSTGNVQPPTQLALSAETVIATWLSSLTLSTLSNLSTSVLPSIKRLSKSGAAQLGSDLGYIANVARALDVEPPEELEAWREAVEVDEKAKLEDLAIDRGILERVARIRGWKRAS